MSDDVEEPIEGPDENPDESGDGLGVDAIRATAEWWNPDNLLAAATKADLGFIRARI